MKIINVKKFLIFVFFVGLFFGGNSFVVGQESTPSTTAQQKCFDQGLLRDALKKLCVNENGTYEGNMVEGIEMNSECLNNGQCKFKIYDLLHIRESVETEGEDSTSPDVYVQDIILAATFFIGTVVTIAIIVSGLMFIIAGATGKDPSKAKSGLINSLIGLLIVICSYSIIRLVQYIAKGF